MNVETVLDFLEGAWEFVCAFAFEIFVGTVILAFALLFALAIISSGKTADERDARLEYCYEQGYAEVIESQHAPYYYCFDARKMEVESSFRPVPENAWKDTK